ncbi:hypothetical protein FEM48_Zijuj07G0131500 [Ziziphus jujuba var. spinosa]|uniref:Xylanase inhibitor C-terminal domain-containing protein n=1 Tax=Ziziphus jujuba var. spinosa TaxID=714518 RepID=A0A978V4U0_ZIZJJ|nr:hypothetical protein FEM48_Zijuj07G0131500 [Ziziphus jujuba var. spinosa]
MHTSIYNSVVDAFVKELGYKVPRVAAVKPFGACFYSAYIGRTRVVPAVPAIDFVLQSDRSVYWNWRMFGANTMVKIGKEVLRLGFVDGGVEQRTSIIIGGHQLKENFLQFDLDNNRLGFCSSLLLRQTTCFNFNFTTY